VTLRNASDQVLDFQSKLTEEINKESLSEYTAGSAKLLDQTNKVIFSDEEKVDESTNSKNSS
jgi:hypothetical protein